MRSCKFFVFAKKEKIAFHIREEMKLSKLPIKIYFAEDYKLKKWIILVDFI